MDDRPQREPLQAGRFGRLAPRDRWAPVRIVATLALGFAAGWAASRVGLPLAWMLGPMLATAACAMLGWAPTPAPRSREFGQAVIGLAIGLRFTPVILASTATLLPAMAVATLGVILITTAAALAVRAMIGLDRQTAFFATAAAGMAEMAMLARDRGADSEAVAVFHAIRVGTIVTVAPLAVYAFGSDGGIPDLGQTGVVPPLPLALMLAGAVAAALLARPARIPNPWLFGPAILGLALAASGLVAGSMPPLLLIVAQVALGVALGARFQRSLMMRLPKVAACAFAVSLGLVAAAAGLAYGLSAATGLSYGTSFLAVAPAGVTEMVLTAKVMHLDTASVTAFHVMRIAAITATTLLTLRVYERLAGWLDAA
ncbi:membrane protein [Alsobacter metallidurans]|uniref:Membrane protein n=1 Tax=Alsobacter metallidurans TaxID=340221 RepID=A0A917MG97_9HYPH|nr:AbrB family transcriptional regulator [Alsobacter metallidurans]GGH09697.1 membrane protein [Alsobacter metallidurans]